MAARATAAARNACTALVTYFDLEQYTKASPEMKDAIQALENVRAGGCKCGNARPTKRFMGCGKHLSCEACHTDFTKVANRKGGCNFPGCTCLKVLWPCRPVEAFDRVQEAASTAFEKLDHALQIEEQKDIGEGARRRAAALGRDEAEEDESDHDVDMASDIAPPANAARRAKRKADYSVEDWEARKRATTDRKEKRMQDAQKLNEHPELQAEIARLQAILEENCLAY